VVPVTLAWGGGELDVPMVVAVPKVGVPHRVANVYLAVAQAFSVVPSRR
jgi:hypothetical protein